MPRKPPRSSEERLARTQKSMTPGTLGGRVASAAPMSVDATRLDPRLRTQKRPLGGGFDPNGDPVVIGNGATATDVSETIVGPGATGTDLQSSAFGNNARAGLQASAFGRGASAAGQHSLAAGYNAQANAPDSTAVGALAYIDPTHSHASALGRDATTTEANQIMLGTVNDFVEIPGDSSVAPNGLVLTDTATGTRYIVRITSGALVLSAAP